MSYILPRVKADLRLPILVDKHSLSHQNARKRMQEQFKSNSARALFSGVAVCCFMLKYCYNVYIKECRRPPRRLIHMCILQAERLKGVSFPSLDQSICCRLAHIDKFTRSALLNTALSHLNALQEYEEVIIPPARPIPPRAEERLMPVSELEELVKGCFSVHFECPRCRFTNLLKDQGYTSLNRIQSIVYQTAYGSNENLLICGPFLPPCFDRRIFLKPPQTAPTGAVSAYPNISPGALLKLF